jgi:hypothetical protein
MQTYSSRSGDYIDMHFWKVDTAVELGKGMKNWAWRKSVGFMRNPK